MKKYFLLACALLIFDTCALVPFTGRRQLIMVSSAEIIPLANENYIQVVNEQGLSKNNNYNASVKRVGVNLSKAVEKYMKEENLSQGMENFNWEFKVLASDQVNAWCMPGGKIAFYEGIMPICMDDNGIAVVMAHEIAHAIALHSNERLSQQLMMNFGSIALSEALNTQKETTKDIALMAFGVGSQLGVMLPYSRLHEKEADELGLYFMAMAGYDPRTAPAFWERMDQEGGARPPEFLSTHPDPKERIKSINKNMNKAMKYYTNSQKQ